MQLQFAAEANEKDGPGNDSIELLSGSVNVRRPGEHDWKIVSLIKSPKAHVRSSARHRVRSARIEWRVLFDETTRASIHFRRRDMDIFLQECALAQTIVKSHSGDDIRHKPMVGVLPTLRDHALGRKIDHVVRFFGSNKPHDVFEITVEIELAELETTCIWFPSIGKKCLMRLWRSAYAENPRSIFQ